MAGDRPPDPRLLQAARLGALGAFSLTTIFVLVYDAVSDTYEVNPLILTILVVLILTLAGYEAGARWLGPR